MKTKSLAIQITLIICLFALPQAFSQQWGLYTLYATKSGTQAYLVDTANSPVTFHTWTFPSTKKSAYSAYLIPGDTLVRTYSYTASGGMTGGGVTGGVQKVLWDGTVVWDFQYNSANYSLHHDICPLPNGNVLMISYELKSTTEATQAGATSSVSIKAEKIIEVKQTGATTGEIVWEWHIWDHLCQNNNSAKDNYVTSIINNPQLININYTTSTDLSDRWHMNGLDYNAELDQIVFSMHFINSAFIIDHSTTKSEAAGHSGGNSGKGGDILYRWGNPASYGATGTASFNVIHDAHWISSDNPNYPNYLAGYNNNGGTSGKTAVDIWNPPYDGYNYTHTTGTAYGPTAYTYRYNSAFTANNEGNSHQLPNGNMLVNNFQGSIYEINSAGTTLWTKTSASSSHAYRYTKCYVRGPIASASASAMSITEGAAINLNSATTSVTETNPSYTYSWSASSGGFSSAIQNPSVTPTFAGTYTYIVTVTNATLGCSDTASVTVTVDANTTTIKNNMINDNAIRVFPNPTNGIVNLEGIDSGNMNYEVTVTDVTGKVLIIEKNIKMFDISKFDNGMYNISIKYDDQHIINKKLSLIK